MIIPKLLLLVPLLLLVEAQNDSQRGLRLSERLPLRRPGAGFRPGATVPPKPSEVHEEVTPENPEYTNVQKKGKPGFTIVFSDSYTENPITSPTTSSTPRQPIKSPSWPRPINKPDNSRSSNVAPVVPRLPSTSTVADVDVTSKNPEVPASEESENQKPGFTIIFSDNTKKPTTVDSDPISEVTGQPIQKPVEIRSTTYIPPLSYMPTESILKTLEPKKSKETYTIIIIKNEEPETDSNNISPTTSSSSKSPVDTTNAPPTTATTKFVTTRPTTRFTTRPTTRPTTGPTTGPTTRPTTRLTTRPTTRFTTRPTTRFTTQPTTSRPPIVVTTKAPTTTQTKQPVTTPVGRTTRTTTTPKTQTIWKPTTTPNQIHDYNCNNVNGYISLENKCDEYIICKNNTAYKNTCPDGLHFDISTHWPAFPCAYPSEVKCESPSVIQPAQPTGDCPHRYGHFPMPNGDCGHFMMCQEGVAIIMPCPSGLAFNPKTSSCDWPVNVPGCHPRAFEGFTCPAQVLDAFGNSDIINFSYNNSCKNYIACHEGHPRLLSCDDGSSFDEATGKCVDSSLVNNCEN